MCILEIPSQKSDAVTSVQFGQLRKPIHSEHSSQRQSNKYKFYSTTFKNLLYSPRYRLQEKNSSRLPYIIKKTEHNKADPIIQEKIFLFTLGSLSSSLTWVFTPKHSSTQSKINPTKLAIIANVPSFVVHTSACSNQNPDKDPHYIWLRLVVMSLTVAVTYIEWHILNLFGYFLMVLFYLFLYCPNV